MNGRSCQLRAVSVVALLSCGLCPRASGVAYAHAPEASQGAHAQASQRGAASASSGVAVSLSELEAHARKAQPGKRLGDARVQEARARIDAARAAYAPSFNLLSEVSLTPGQRIVTIEDYKVNAAFPLGTSGAFRPAARYGVTLDVRSNLYDFGRTRAAVDAAEAALRAERAQLRGAAEQAVLDVRAGYLRWATAHALWSIAQRTQRAAEQQLERTRAAIEEGARPSIALSAAQSGEGFARLELERARAELDGAREDLGYVAGADLDEGAFPADDVLQMSGTEPVRTSQQAQRDARVQALREQQSAASANARAHEHALRPVVSASAQAGVQGLNENLFPVYRVGVSVLVPLWDGGAEAANRGQAQALAAQLGAQVEQLERGQRRADQRSQQLRRQAERRISIAAQLVQVCGARLEQLEEASPLDAATRSEVAEARSALSRAQTELVMARALRAQAMLGLD